MSEPPWAKLLDAYYQNGGWMYSIARKDVSYSDLPDKNRLTAYEFGDEHVYVAHNMLDRTGLIEKTTVGEIGAREAGRKDHVVWYKLTEKGFNVAHERELSRRENDLFKSQNESNKILAVFTVLLATTAIVQAIADIISLGQYRLAVGILYLALAFVAITVGIELLPESDSE